MERVTVQIFVQEEWRDAAEVAFYDADAGIPGGAVFNYLSDYFFDYGAAGFAEDAPERGYLAVSIACPLIVAPTRAERWPAFLLDMMPQGEGRERLLKELGFAAREQSPKADFPLLVRAAAGPIGNLRIKEAAAAEAERLVDIEVTGIEMSDVVDRTDRFRNFVERFGLLASSASSVQGAWPKMLLTRAEDGLWYPDAPVPAARARDHVIVKLLRNNTESDRRILAAEAPYLEIARRLGLRVARPLEAHRNAVVIPRFDREVTPAGVTRRGQESMTSALGVADFGHTTSHEAYLDVIKDVSVNPREDVIEYVKRDVLNMAMGNPDNHGRNTALQKRVDGTVSLTPLFDFTPMRLDEEGVVRSTRWECLQRNELQPNWAVVCEAAAEGVMPKEELARELLALAPLLRELPRIADDAGLDPDTFDQACGRHTEITATLDELERVVDAAPEETLKR